MTFTPVNGIHPNIARSAVNANTSGCRGGAGPVQAIGSAPRAVVKSSDMWLVAERTACD